MRFYFIFIIYFLFLFIYLFIYLLYISLQQTEFNHLAQKMFGIGNYIELQHTEYSVEQYLAWMNYMLSTAKANCDAEKFIVQHRRGLEIDLKSADERQALEAEVALPFEAQVAAAQARSRSTCSCGCFCNCLRCQRCV